MAHTRSSSAARATRATISRMRAGKPRTRAFHYRYRSLCGTRAFRPIASFGAHIVGSDNVDGSDTQVVAFFENLGVNSPFWFRLWADAYGLVHRAEMRGQGHFMDEHYTDFDAPFTIQPPT